MSPQKHTLFTFRTKVRKVRLSFLATRYTFQLTLAGCQRNQSLCVAIKTSSHIIRCCDSTPVLFVSMTAVKFSCSTFSVSNKWVNTSAHLCNTTDSSPVTDPLANITSAGTLLPTALPGTSVSILWIAPQSLLQFCCNKASICFFSKPL